MRVIGDIKRIEYGLHYPFGIAKHLVVPEPQDTHAVGLQRPRALCIVRSLLWLRMLAAIQLDAEPGFVAVEIEDVPTHRMLPAELGAGQLAIAQQLPEQALSIGCVLAKLPDALQEFAWQAGFDRDG